MPHRRQTRKGKSALTRRRIQALRQVERRLASLTRLELTDTEAYRRAEDEKASLETSTL